MLEFFEEFETLTASGTLNPDSLAALAEPYGTTYQRAVTVELEQRYGVSASLGRRP